ncbi:disulfide bond formation protein DsbA [Streptomyces sp. HNM0575]|uniref:mycothiol-dependent nitroreductase Rv2466c family protein n=1 Tax=Streptomyces sp. HNM0575 TaxID=2716338 RepID=UPI00145CEC0F|nr:disulfide bond formation protein DsbA [Streptomyces sp. HNM0575]NLU72305.1 disulfide bond formation protein DsbA [Streptomyces sp. HNM0575]
MTAGAERAQGPGAGPGPDWSVDFWLDPACPLTRHTARWIAGLAEGSGLRVCRRVMSLAVLNEHRDDDPEGDPDGYLWIPARVAAAVQTEHGHDALGAFYDALWTEPDGQGGQGGRGGAEREWIGDIAEALGRAGLPAALAGAGTSADYDRALRASHHAGVDRIDAEIGTPVLAVTAPGGEQCSFFGPVLETVPGERESLRLWSALAHLVHVPGFHQLRA